jgi:polyribonucleotide nucleotidyltransferase
MERIIPAPRPGISMYAPRLVTIHINPEKIGKLIGPGGKMIRGLQEKYAVGIDVEDDGTVMISAPNGEAIEACKSEIEALTEEIKVGTVYTGKVVSVKDFGAFVELAPGTDGMCHVSELSDQFVKSVNDVVRIGDMIKVKVILVDDQGRIKLSRKAVLMEENGGQPAMAEAGAGSGGHGGGGHDGGGHGGHGGGGGGRDGGHRGGGGGGRRDGGGGGGGRGGPRR